MKPNISKFSWAELFSNETGKTSASGFAGVVISLVGTLCFFMGCIDKMFFTNSVDIITQSIILVGIGVTLLGVRKVTKSGNVHRKEKEETTTQSNTIQQEPIQQINS
jgi:hypothetical protein